MGHRLPHAFRADGSFIFTFEEAVASLVKRLYPGAPPSSTAQSPRTRKKRNRNADIRARYAQGVSVPDLAKEYGISRNRVYQILREKRK
jgi:DNA invertase Pin-like site-specific DNA recombinase